MGELCLELADSGCEGCCGVPLGESPETMKMSAQCIVDGGWWNEEIADGGEDGYEALASAWGSKFLHDPFAFS